MTSTVTSKLKALVEQTQAAYPHYSFRGVASCSLCLSAGMPSPGPIWSQENILVPGDLAVYVAPGGIIQYIEAHSYLPPSEFTMAVLKCPECKSMEYREALRTANRYIEPPLETDESFSREILRHARLSQSLKKDPANLDLANECWAALRANARNCDLRDGRNVIHIYRAAALRSSLGVVALARAYRELFEVSGEGPRLAYFDEALTQAMKSSLPQLSEQERSMVQWIIQSIDSPHSR